MCNGFSSRPSYGGAIAILHLPLGSGSTPDRSNQYHISLHEKPGSAGMGDAYIDGNIVLSKNYPEQVEHQSLRSCWLEIQ